MIASQFPVVPFSQAVRDTTGGNFKVQGKDYQSIGEIPVVDQGQDFTSGFTDSSHAYQGELPVVLFGDHTKALKYVDFSFALGADGVKVLTPAIGFEAKFLYFYFRSLRLPDAGYSRHFKFLKEVLVPKPTIEQQSRIVDLLSRADGIVKLRRDAHRKAAELIPAIFLEMFGDPATNPKGWPVKPLVEVAAFMSGGTPPKAREDLWSGTLPWVSPKDMKVDCIADAIDHVSDSVLTETNLKLVPIGSILIVVRGMILVHTVPIAITSTPVTINQDMKALMPSKSIDPSFLLWALKVQHPKLLALVDTAAHGTKKLDTAKIQTIGIPIPPLQIQRQFVERADSVASIIAQQNHASDKAEVSFDALLSKAFAGS